MAVSFELINSLASVGTFAVIAASALAAMIQLRHVRATNQIALLSKLYDTLQSAEFLDARRFIAYELATLLHDPATLEQLRNPPLTGQLRFLALLGNFYENTGLLVRRGMLDREMVCEIWAGIIAQTWYQIAPALAFIRAEPQGDDVWQNFEYLVVISEDWTARHPGGDYPKGVRRLVMPPLPFIGPNETPRSVDAERHVRSRTGPSAGNGEQGRVTHPSS